MQEVAEIIIKSGAVIGALVAIGAIINKIFRFIERQKQQDAEIESLKTRVAEENTLICYGLMACLDGLEQLGANHEVPKAKLEIDKYLNKQAHKS